MSNLSDISVTSLKAAQANVLTAISAQVDALNRNAITAYLLAFGDWAQQITAGRSTDLTTAPRPPAAYVVGYYSDPTTGPGSVGPYGDTVIEWAYPAIGDDPVCPMPPLPQIPPSVVHIDTTGNEHVRGAPPGLAKGTRIKDADGSVWIVQELATPFGVARAAVRQR